MAALPVDRLSDEAGHMIGFVMPHIDKARGIHDLYSPRGRQAHFANADFRFLVHVAVNIARLFATVHEHGLIIGDVNHGNILVCADGTVAAIDCDSFQVGDGSALSLPCGCGAFYTA